MLNLSVIVSLLTKIRLNENCDKHRIEVKLIKEVGWIVSNPRTHDVDPFAKVKVKVEGCDWNIVNKLLKVDPHNLAHEPYNQDKQFF